MSNIWDDLKTLYKYDKLHTYSRKTKFQLFSFARSQQKNWLYAFLFVILQKKMENLIFFSWKTPD